MEKTNTKQRTKRIKTITKITVACVLFVGILFLLAHGFFAVRGHGGGSVEQVRFEESGKTLKNPNRGMYQLTGYYIQKEMEDYRNLVAENYAYDTESTITLVQINLQEFANGPITEQGLRNIENLFSALATIDKQLIVRFLYDWQEKNEETEPKSIDIILNHMEQVAPVVNAYSDRIWMLQGLFIGNWGEMNGTRYTGKEDIEALAAKLDEVIDDDIYLAVRMPMHWRMATGNPDLEGVAIGGDGLANRLGIYNDGMLGNAYDYGTYGEQSKTAVGDYSYWNREEELAFQDSLCRVVPIGGEVIVPNSYNDFENAVADFSRMHVSYLNRFYDEKVYSKWFQTTISDGSVFDGQPGFLYIENKLGYRLVLTDNQMDYNAGKDTLDIQLKIKNIGFAPLYAEPKAMIYIVNSKTGVYEAYPFASDLRELAGGVASDEIQVLEKTIPMFGKRSGTYDIYFKLSDEKSGDQIYFGVDREPTDMGYLLGTVTLKKKPL